MGLEKCLRLINLSFSSRRSVFVSVRGLMPPRESSNSPNLRGLSMRSLMTSSEQGSPSMSATRATGQDAHSFALWLLVRSITPHYHTQLTLQSKVSCIHCTL